MFQSSSIVLTDICRSFLRVSKVTEKIKTRSKPTPSENFNSHPLGIRFVVFRDFWIVFYYIKISSFLLLQD
jgi:hypothetical protein